jgi:hypothetical protein
MCSVRETNMMKTNTRKTDFLASAEHRHLSGKGLSVNDESLGLFPATGIFPDKGIFDAPAPAPAPTSNLEMLLALLTEITGATK